jgi:hypothetical protein
MVSAVKRVEIVSDRMLYIILKGRWCDIILNVHAQTEGKIDDINDRFCEELEHIYDNIMKDKTIPSNVTGQMKYI